MKIINKASSIIKKFYTPHDKISELCIVSYPKCGRGFIAALISKVLETHFGVKNVDVYDNWQPQKMSKELPIPNISFTHSRNPHRKPPSKIKYYGNKFKNSKVIFMVRDPRDVIVSLYFHRTKRSKNYNKSLSDFIVERTGGFDSILAFYNMWAKNRHIPQDFLLLKYEDLRTKTKKELLRILDFMNLTDVRERCIDEAIEFSSFEKMKSYERNNTLNRNKLKPVNIDDTESFKTRRGKIGGYKDYLSKSEIELLNKKIQDNLSEYYSYYF